MNISSQVVDVIDASKRLRPLDEEAVASLTESMRQLGLLQPILVHAPDDEQLILVAGAHRLEAAKRLGWDVIDCIYVDGDEIDCELHEITENLHRAELTVLERSNQTARWVELIGAKRVISDNLSENQTEPVAQPKRKRGRPGNASKAAPEIGANEREVRRSVKIASIAPAAQQAARNAGIDDNQSALLKVAKEATTDAQVAKVKEIEAAKATPPTATGQTNIVQFILRQESQQEADCLDADETIGGDEIDDDGDFDTSDLEAGAKVIYGSLSNIDLVNTTPEVFWEVHSDPVIRDKATKWLDASIAMLTALRAGSVETQEEYDSSMVDGSAFGPDIDLRDVLVDPETPRSTEINSLILTLLSFQKKFDDGLGAWADKNESRSAAYAIAGAAFSFARHVERRSLELPRKIERGERAIRRAKQAVSKAYHKRFGAAYVGFFDENAIRLMQESLDTGVDQLAKTKEENRLHAEQIEREHEEFLRTPIGPDTEAHYTALIKKRELYEGACELAWVMYFQYRDEHTNAVEPLTDEDLAYAGMWTACAVPQDEAAIDRVVNEMLGSAERVE